jgi:hypothetical protein
MQPQFSQLGADEQEVFNLYKANSPFAGQQFFADFMNQALRERRDLPLEWAEKMATMDAIIEKGTFENASMVFRATVDRFVAPYISGDELNYPAYMSTARDKDTVQRHFSGGWHGIPAALLCISCSTGAIALDLEINPSFGGHEQEALLPKNSKFIVTQIQEITDKMAMNQLMSAFYAEGYSSLKVYELLYEGRT